MGLGPGQVTRSRPLLVELGAAVPTPCLAVLESELDELDSVLRRWVRSVAGALGHPVPEEPPALASRR